MKRVIYFAVFVGVAIVLLVVFVIFYLRVQAPLAHLIRATTAFGAGQFVTVNVKRRDEIGRVSQAFNDMVANLSQAHEALRKSEATLKSLFRAAPIGMGLLRQRVFVLANEQMSRMIGYSGAELEGQNARILYATEAEFNRVGTVKYLEMRERGLGTIETQWQSRDGRIIEVLLSSSSIDPVDPDAGTVFTALDITARKRAEEALKESEARYRELVENANSIILRVDPEGRITFFNEFAECFFGYPKHDILGQNVVGTIVPARESSGRDLEALVRDIIRNPERYLTIEHENIKRSGERVWVAWTNKAILNAQGQVTEILCVGNDITELKRTEAELLQYQDDLERMVAERTLNLSQVNQALQQEIAEHQLTEAALRESEARFRIIFEGAPIGIVLQDQDGRYLAINPAMERLLGYPEEEFDHLGWSFLHPDDAPQVLLLFQELAAGRRDSFTLENRAFHQGGRMVWGRMTMARIKGKEDHTWYALGLIEDITAEKQLQKERTAYQEKLRALATELTLAEERERRRLAADLHDHIGQILALVQIRMGELSQVGASPVPEKTVQEIRDYVGEAIYYTRSLTFELGLPVLYDLGLEAAVEWLAEQFQSQHGLTVAVQQDALPKPLGEAASLLVFRILREVLTNVVKHARASRVDIVLRREDHRLFVQVADNGVGFDPASVASPALRFNGYGLFSIKERLGHMGGALNVESQPHQGTLVTISVPLEEPLAPSS